MKILFIISNIHHKNLNSILKCKKINFSFVNSVNDINNWDLSIFDAVISTCDPVDVVKYPNTKFIFGPHFSIFPDNKLDIIKGNNAVYNSLSDWVINLWKLWPICDNLNLIKLPFGVDTEKFCEIKPINERENVIIYFKHRNPDDLLFIQNFLINKSIPYIIFSYNTKYNEDDYIKQLQNSKYCIWVDAHESQGFALQEALSCNVPLLVWNVTSMNQEYGQNYDDLQATTLAYWDDCCGDFFYNKDEINDKFNLFISKINDYNPRQFILDNLSVEACEDKLIRTIENIII